MFATVREADIPAARADVMMVTVLEPIDVLVFL
jgi:hypothetical protein